MRLESVIYQPKARLAFSLREIRIMKQCAKHHYDSACKATVAKPHESNRWFGGLLVTTENYHRNTNGQARTFTWDEIDTLAKVLEASLYHPNDKSKQIGWDLHLRLVGVLKCLNALAVPDFMLDTKNPNATFATLPGASLL